MLPELSRTTLIHFKHTLILRELLPSKFFQFFNFEFIDKKNCSSTIWQFIFYKTPYTRKKILFQKLSTQCVVIIYWKDFVSQVIDWTHVLTFCTLTKVSCSGKNCMLNIYNEIFKYLWAPTHSLQSTRLCLLCYDDRYKLLAICFNKCIIRTMYICLGHVINNSVPKKK